VWLWASAIDFNELSRFSCLMMLIRRKMMIILSSWRLADRPYLSLRADARYVLYRPGYWYHWYCTVPGSLLTSNKYVTHLQNCQNLFFWSTQFNRIPL
jgi:hypothetical protein